MKIALAGTGTFGAKHLDGIKNIDGVEVIVANAVQGPIHPELGIAMDMSMQLKPTSGKICT